jgi:hypothetical protein
MTQVNDERRGRFRATADTLSDKEAHEWIVEFYDLLLRSKRHIMSHAEHGE